MNRFPAFEFYSKDWLSNRTIRYDMDAEQRGWLSQLMAEAWESDTQGTLPNDPKFLWLLAGAESRDHFESKCAVVLAQFEVGQGCLINHMLCDQIAKKQCHFEARSKAGQEGGRVRRENRKKKNLEHLTGSNRNNH